MCDDTVTLMPSEQPLTYKDSSTSNAKRVSKVCITNTDTPFTDRSIEGKLFVGNYNQVALLNQSNKEILSQMELHQETCEVDHKKHLARLLHGVLQRSNNIKNYTLRDATTMLWKQIIMQEVMGHKQIQQVLQAGLYTKGMSACFTSILSKALLHKFVEAAMAAGYSFATEANKYSFGKLFLIIQYDIGREPVRAMTMNTTRITNSVHQIWSIKMYGPVLGMMQSYSKTCNSGRANTACARFPSERLQCILFWYIYVPNFMWLVLRSTVEGANLTWPSIATLLSLG
jgi:hypothetical protein